MRIKQSKIIFSLFCVLFPCLLSAQKKDENRQWQKYIAPKEKKSLSLGDFNTLGYSHSWEKNIDTLIWSGKKYLFPGTPISTLYKAEEILFEGDAGTIGAYKKKYILRWEIKNDSLYIVDYDIAPDYYGDKTKDDVRKDIELLLGKFFKNNELNIDWMIVEDAPKTTVRLLGKDEQGILCYFIFEKGRFVKVEERRVKQ